MPLKITLCKCYFGGDTCNYCGSSGVIIDEREDDNIIKNPNERKKYLEIYLERLKKVNDNIEKDRYNKNIILNNIKKVHESKRTSLTLHHEVSPLWSSCQTEYQNIINKLNNIKTDEPILQSELYLFDIAHYNSKYHFFSLNNQCKSEKIKLIFIKDNMIKTVEKETKDFFKFLNPRDKQTIPQNIKLIAIDFEKLEHKESFKSLIFVEDTMPKIKFYYYKTNTQTGCFYYIDWDYFIETLGIKL